MAVDMEVAEVAVLGAPHSVAKAASTAMAGRVMAAPLRVEAAGEEATMAPEEFRTLTTAVLMEAPETNPVVEREGTVISPGMREQVALGERASAVEAAAEATPREMTGRVVAAVEGQAASMLSGLPVEMGEGKLGVLEARMVNIPQRPIPGEMEDTWCREGMEIIRPP